MNDANFTLPSLTPDQSLSTEKYTQQKQICLDYTYYSNLLIAKPSFQRQKSSSESSSSAEEDPQEPITGRPLNKITILQKESQPNVGFDKGQEKNYDIDLPDLIQISKHKSESVPLTKGFSRSMGTSISVSKFKKSNAFTQHGQTKFYDRRSLFIFRGDYKIRKAIVWLVDWRLHCGDFRVRPLSETYRVFELLPVQSIRLRALRVLRVLKPLRSINALPSLKRNVSALIQSIPDFLNVGVFLGFIFLLFAILGTHQFNGILYSQCRFNRQPESPNSWAKSSGRVCSKSRLGIYNCPEEQYCGHPDEFGMSLEDDGVYDNKEIFYGASNFDNVGNSLFVIFRITTTEDWNSILQDLMDTDIPFLAVIFCFTIIIIGSFFIMNLILAVIIQAFITIQKKELELELSNQSLEKKKSQQNLVNQDDNKGSKLGLNDKNSTQRENIRKSIHIQQLSDKRKTLKKNLTDKDAFQSILKPTLENQIANDDKSGTKLEFNQKLVVEPIRSQIDLSFLKPLAMQRKVVNMFNNSVNLKKSDILSIEHNSEQDDQLNKGFKDQKDQQDVESQESQKPILKGLFNQLAQKKLDLNIERRDSTESNKVQLAFQQFIDKKKDEIQSREDFFNEILQETKDNYLKAKESQINSLRQLSTLRLGLKIRRKQNNLAREFQKFKAEHRADQNLCFKISFKIVDSQLFSFLITICIIVNTLVLALDRLRIEDDEKYILEQLNIGFSIIFFGEAILKLIGLGYKSYFKDAYNSFDCFIALASVIDLFISNLVHSYDREAGAITSLRTFRLLRVFKLAKSWKQLHGLLKTIGKTLKDVSTFSILLFLFIFIYTLLGMELFAYQAKFDDYGNLDMVNGSFPLANFNNFLDAFLTVFTVLTGDVWSSIYINYYRAVGNGETAIIFFISLIVIGEKILLNLFLAILLENFDEDSLDQEYKKQFKENQNLHNQNKTKIEKCLGWLKYKITDFFSINIDIKSIRVKKPQQKKNQIIPSTKTGDISLKGENLQNNEQNKLKSERKLLPKMSTSGIDQNLYLDGKALFFLQSESFLRVKFFDIVTSKKFEYVTVIVIIISSIHLALENPLNDPNGQLVEFLNYIDIGTTVFFLLEFLIKVITFGFLMNGRTSYLRNPWNLLDFVIISLSIISLTPLPSELKIIKILRVVRPLRLISRNKGLKVAVKALAQAIPNIANITIIMALFFAIFGIIGVSFFKGTLFICSPVQLDIINNFEAKSKWDCLNIGGHWLASPFGYDDLIDSIQTFFQLATSSDWSNIMYQSISTTNIDYVQNTKNRPMWSLFFVLFIIIGGFFFFNLFVGVVISNFNREKDKIGGNNLLTDQQKEWIDQRLLIMNSKPQKKLKPADNIIRKLCFKIVENKYFDSFILVCILLNTFVLTLKWHREPNEITTATENLNYIFTSIFVIEVNLKILAYGKLYFKDGWNIFDILVALGTFGSIFISSFTSVSLGGATSIVRAFRISRVFRLIKRAKSLRLIFNTFIVTLPALVNVGALLLLVQYLYSVLGVYMFAEVKRNGIMSEVLNFENFQNAFITLFIVATGDSWDQIMDSTIKQQEINFQCKLNPIYQDYQDNQFQTVGCGSRYEALCFYYSYFLLVNLILLKLFIAIILQGFEDTQSKENRIFNHDTLIKFRKVWADFDPEANSFIPIGKLKEFLFQLGGPLGWDSSYKGSLYKQEQYIIGMNLPTYNDFSDYQFLDVLDALSIRLMAHENYQKEQDQNQSLEEEIVVSDESMKQGDKSPINRMNTAYRIDIFQKKMIQDINKLKYQEEAQNIEAVQIVQNKELQMKTSQNNLNKDTYTSLHQAAAELAFNHMRRIVVKKRLQKQLLASQALQPLISQNEIIVERSIRDEISPEPSKRSNGQQKPKLQNIIKQVFRPSNRVYQDKDQFIEERKNSIESEFSDKNLSRLSSQNSNKDISIDQEIQQSIIRESEELKEEANQIERILEQEIQKSRRQSLESRMQEETKRSRPYSSFRGRRNDGRQRSQRNQATSPYQNKNQQMQLFILNRSRIFQGSVGGTCDMQLNDENLFTQTQEQIDDDIQPLSRQPSSSGALIQHLNESNYSKTQRDMNMSRMESVEISKMIQEEIGRIVESQTNLLAQLDNAQSKEDLEEIKNQIASEIGIQKIIEEVAGTQIYDIATKQSIGEQSEYEYYEEYDDSLDIDNQ